MYSEGRPWMNGIALGGVDTHPGDCPPSARGSIWIQRVLLNQEMMVPK